MSKKIAIVDFKLGNLFSVKQACKVTGLDATITADKKIVQQADALILPGVGAFCEAMNNLKSFGLIEPIQNHVSDGKPLFGICLGMQLLFTESEEFGQCKGLDILKGKIIKFNRANGDPGGNGLKVPQIGWNRIYKENQTWSKTPFSSIDDGNYMYFVHSYFAVPDSREQVLSITRYGGNEYCSTVYTKKGIFATQFHPEKSGKKGLEIYRKWAEVNQLI